MASFLNSIKLINFRNFTFKELDFNANKILITGNNGSGKTSILESISLLSQGRGLRGEKFCFQINQNSNNAEIIYDFESHIGNIILEQKYSRDSSKRSIFLNSKAIKSGELSKLSSIFWLIPQQNILFSQAQSERRKFFDRIVFAFFHDHAEQVAKYEYYQRERLKILSMDFIDENWLSIIEMKMSELAISITNARMSVKNELNSIIDNLDTPFPKLKIILDGELEDLYIKNLDENLKDELLNIYIKYRSLDKDSHRTHFGALKMDFRAEHAAKSMDASLCSTGEQQSCLITILLAQTEHHKRLYDNNPILLLDELFVHLDENNKSYLSDFIVENEIQTFVTTTEKELCPQYSKDALIINLK